MHLKLILNIGKLDAQRLGLKGTKAGDTVDVDEATADVLLQNNWARRSEGEAEGEGEGEPAAVEASPAAPKLISSADLPAGRGGARTTIAENAAAGLPVEGEKAGEEKADTPAPAPAQASPKDFGKNPRR